MMELKLKTAKLQARVARAKSAVGRGTRYGLGHGGMNAKDELPTRNGRCDCSGFAAWAIGISRYQFDKGKAWSKAIPWIETTAIVKDATGPQKLFKQIPYPVVGAIVVYPDRKILGVWRQGHVALAVDVHDSRRYEVVHCSVGNDKKGDAIQVTPGDLFQSQHAIFCVLNEDFEELPVA